MLANMRDHLLAVSLLQSALAVEDYDAASEIAERRLGMSAMGRHGAGHMARVMPEGMRAIGSEMHRAASRFAIIAQDASVDQDLAAALAGLAEVTNQCVACHAAYRIH